MSKRNQGSTPRPKEFRYARQALHMPVAVAGQVKRGKIVGKGEDDMSDKKPKHTHIVWHIAEHAGPGIMQAHGNVSAKHAVEAVSKFKERFPQHKDANLEAHAVSSTRHTPPTYPASHHYELVHQDKMVEKMEKNAEGMDKANKALWDHQRGQTPEFPLIGQAKNQAAKMDARMPKAAGSIAAPPAPKKPASTLSMDWLNQQKKLLTQKSEETDVAGLLWLFGTSEGITELSKMMVEQGEELKKNKP